MNPRRALLLTALVIFGVLAFAYANHRGLYDWFFWATGVDVTFRPYLPFADFDEILAANQCHRMGVDVFLADPCDLLRRPHAYSPLWLAGSFTGLGPQDLFWTGGALVLAFLATAIGIAAPRSYGEAAIVLLALLSQSALYAMERANIDLIMFLLVVGAAVLFARGARARIAAYAVIYAAALLKFYPVVALGLALHERPRRMLALAAASVAGAAVFALAFWHELNEMWVLIPRPGPFSDAFGGMNFFQAIRYLLSLYAPAWEVPYGFIQPVLYVAALVAALKTALVTGPRMAEAMGGRAPMTPRAAIFLAGAFILVAAFFLGKNVAYRGIWLLTILPSVLYFRRQSSVASARRHFWSAGVALVLLLLWGECFHAHVGEWAGDDWGRAFASLVREPLWWIFMVGLMSMLWAQLTQVTPAASLEGLAAPHLAAVRRAVRP